MRPCDVIVRKRDGRTHLPDEISSLIEGFTRGDIPDYQVSAWLMAVYLNGLDDEETYRLTEAMLHSGTVYDLTSVEGPKVDKHSTGGVGDKVSLILAPAVAACGVFVPMTSGRGLGFTGGTLDKLESIPGYRVLLSEEEFVSILRAVGFVMSGQTDALAPADRKLYALRDVTGTVESIPLITSSILSKKFAEGVDAVVMDVKFGSGAFMKSIDLARALSRSLIGIAERLGKRVVCVLTNMDQPLGRAVGNGVEVAESIDVLKGGGPTDIVELVSVLGGHMLLSGGVTDDLTEARSRVEEAIASGRAYDLFLRSVERQGGDVDVIKNPEKLPAASRSEDILAEKNGFVTSVDAQAVGTASLLLGAGRFKKEDAVDPAAGIIIHKKRGERVTSGQTLATLHFNDDRCLEEARVTVKSGFAIGSSKPPAYRLIHDTLTPER
jgi:pyrimidine-nucleoside phosphorylase